MTADSVKMLKKVSLFDAGITLISLVVTILFFRNYTLVVFIGLVVSVVNYLLNIVVTTYSMKRKLGALMIVLGFLARLLIAGAFAVILCQGDLLNVVGYITGYSLHYISIILGVLTKKYEEG